MTFVNPFLLTGIALIGVPILLHLLMRQKPRHLEFPALRLVKKRHEVNRRRMRFQHLLLLLLRILVIGLLAFALARPSLQWSGALGSQEAPVAAALIFDTAAHMEYRQNNQTRLEAAKELGAWLLKQLPRESRVAVLGAAEEPVVFQVDRGAAGQRIEQLAASAVAGPLPRVIENAVDLLKQSDLPRKEIYVFTDLAETAWPSDSAEALQRSLDAADGMSFYLIDVGVTKPVDYGLSRLRLSSQVLSDRTPLRLQTEITRLGPPGQRTVELYVLDASGDPRRRDSVQTTVDADTAAPLDFSISGFSRGLHQGFVRIVGQDALSPNDTRYFTINIQPAWPILIAAPQPTQERALFLVEALAPTAFRQTGKARFDCRVIPLESLAGTELSEYAAVCLLDPSPLSADTWQKLADYVSDGHGLGVFLGRRAVPVGQFGSEAAKEVLPATPLRQVRRPEGDVALAPHDTTHPILSIFKSRAGSVPWSMFPVYRYWQLSDRAAGTNEILAYGDGSAAVLERPLGRGRVLLMTTPVSDPADERAWNLLPIGQAWPFMILSNQMMLYLVGAADVEFNYYPGQTAVVPFSGSDKTSLVLTTPSGVTASIPADAAAENIRITTTDEAGNYTLQAGGSSTGVRTGFSVNLPLAQTDLNRIGKEGLDRLFGGFPYRVARNRDEIDRDVSEARVGRELFPLFMVLLVVVLAVEQVMANRFYRE